LRVVESAGIGVLIAAAMGLAVVAFLYARQQSAEIAVGGILAGGMVAGGILGLRRRPSALQVAIEADRQLHLPELFSSAAMLPPAAATDPLDRALRQTLAERAALQCSGKLARRIRLRKFGANGWAAIALGAGVPLLLGTLISPRPPAGAAEQDADRPAAAVDPGDAPLVQLADTAAGARQEMHPDEPVTGGDRPGPFSQAPEQPNAPAQTPIGNPRDPSPSASPSGNASGPGSSRTAVDQQPSPTRFDTPVIGSPNPSAGVSTGGAGPAAPTPAAGDTATPAGGIGRTIDSAPTPPWQSARWPAEANAARQQVNSGQIPAAYRDLVRDYFSPTGEE
jgi:hypothetical protein